MRSDIMEKATISRRAVLHRVLRSPLAWATVFVATTAILWPSHEGWGSFLAVLAWACLSLLVVGLFPMALGFGLQWAMPASRMRPVFWLLAGVIAGAVYFSADFLPTATGHLSTWVSWSMAGVLVLLLVSFLDAGAKACRWCFPKRFSSDAS
jgi:hypothetical protein